MNKLDLINRYIKEKYKKKREAQWDRIKKLLKYARE
jgi:hypothetical protein